MLDNGLMISASLWSSAFGSVNLYDWHQPSILQPSILQRGAGTIALILASRSEQDNRCIPFAVALCAYYQAEDHMADVPFAEE
jgi:hypothetical protein